jgi:pimeloyl-ACP methyl ester carboxylesterase
VATFLLVHGAWQGAWAWQTIVDRLGTAGHAAIAVDLPGDGSDATPAGAVTTMLYAERVTALIDAMPEDEKVIVVGHSMGGTVAAQVSELRPARIAVAVYLCAFLIRDGESIVDFFGRAWQDWMTGAHARVSYSDDGTQSMIDPESALAVFYHMADPADSRAAAARLTPQPEGGRRSQLSLSADRFGRVPRIYIETLQDRSVFHELQQRMYTETPCDRVYTLDADHAPQLSAPDALTALLCDVAISYLPA